MSPARNPLTRAITDLAAFLRFPYLFLLTATLFVLDVLIPDLVPFADEILRGLLTLLFGSWRKSRKTPPVDGTGSAL